VSRREDITKRLEEENDNKNKRVGDRKVDELEGSVTGVVHLDCDLGEHTYLYKF
jgi:hypothetical protein